MQRIQSAILLAILLVSTAAALSYGAKKSEQAECIKWAQQAREYPGFYYTQWQREQCAAVMPK